MFVEKTIGYHWWADLSNCTKSFVEAEPARDLALSIVEQAGMTVVGEANVTISDGVDSGAMVITVIVPLKESHLAIHSFPELKYNAVDLFTCGDMLRGRDAFVTLCNWFEPQFISRGFEIRKSRIEI